MVRALAWWLVEFVLWPGSSPAQGIKVRGKNISKICWGRELGNLNTKNPNTILFNLFPFPVLKFAVSYPRRDTIKLTSLGVYSSLAD